MKKALDLFFPPYPYWHETTIGRLSSILKYGLVSPSKAKKLGIDKYRKVFDSSWNVDAVSLMANKSPREATAPRIAILVDPKKVRIIKPEFQKNDTNRPSPDEILVKGKIIPKKFVGLVVGEIGYSYRLEKYVKPRPLSLKRVIGIVQEANLGFDLPVYFKGKKVN